MAEPTNFPQNIEKVWVYKSVKEGLLEGNLSALVVTGTGEVWGTGVNTMVGCSTYHNEHPMLEGGSQILNRWVRIDKLSGLGIRKIIIGSGFGAAITDNRLLTWGRGPVTSLGRNAVVAFQGYQPNLHCRMCSKNHCYREKKVGGVSLNYCQVLKESPILTNVDGVTAHKFVKFHDDFLYCSNCTGRCSSKKINSIALYYCTTCDMFWDADSNVGPLVANSTWIKRESRIITDITPYGWGIWVLTDNKLLWSGFVKLSEWEESPTINPNNVRMRSVHCCGAGTFVTTEDGEVHSCSDLVLKRVPLPAAVVKVCCGQNAAVCLLVDKSVWVVDDPPERLLSSDSQAVDLAVLEGHDIFYVQAECNITSVTVEMKFSGGNRTLQLNMATPECRSFLWSMVCSTPFGNSSTPVQNQPSVPTIPALQTSNVTELTNSLSLKQSASSGSSYLHSFLGTLYGQKSSSDMTIKLSDGDFHAHRCVLMEMSSHFKKTLQNTRAPVVVHMTSANPDAYRCLLKHFYKQKLDDLNFDGLFDLRQLALSYEELPLADATEKKIWAQINDDNVLHAFGMSKLFSCDKINEYCKELMKKPTVKQQIIDKILRNPLVVLLLQSENDETQTGNE